MREILREKTKAEKENQWVKQVFTIKSIKNETGYSSDYWFCGQEGLLFEGDDFAMYWKNDKDFEVHCIKCGRVMTTGSIEYFEKNYILKT